MSESTPKHFALTNLYARMATPACALIGYAALAAVIFAPLIAKLSTHILADDVFIHPGQSDAYTGLWTYWWTHRAVLMWTDVLHCTWVLPPTGADLLFHSTSLAPTVLTLPLAGFFGEVVGYNLMVILLIIGGAWMYYYFLRRTFDASGIAAFWTGALFGFCPYFLFKAHAHINLIGAVFWGGSLALVIHAYLRDRFTLRQSLLFGFMLWLTFWTSLVEFFMLIIVLAVTIVVLECLSPAKLSVGPLSRRLRFYVPAILGGIPAIVLYHSSHNEVVSKNLFTGLTVGELFSLPRLNMLVGNHFAKPPEYWGTYLPIVTVILAIVGINTMAKKQMRLLIILGLLASICLLLTLDPRHCPSTIVRAMPMGAGFRVFGRFFPLFFFFLLVIACQGLDKIIALSRSAILRAIALSVLLVLGIAEYYPAKLNPLPVKAFHIAASTKQNLDREKFVLVIPDGDYKNIHDTYQASLDMRFVNLSYLAREDSSLAQLRMTQFPIVYGGRQPNDLDRFKRELSRLGVSYLLFESRVRSVNFPLQGKVVAEDNGQVLVDISEEL